MGRDEILGKKNSAKERILGATGKRPVREIPSEPPSLGQALGQRAKAGIGAAARTTPLGSLFNFYEGFQAAGKLNEAKNAAINTLVEGIIAGKGFDLSSANQAAQEAYQEGQPVPLRAARQFTSPESGTTAKVGAKVTDFLLESATDPVNLLTGPLAKGATMAGKAGLAALKEAPAVVRLAKEFTRITNPIAQRYATSPLKAGIELTLDAFGFGPLRGMRREAIKPYELTLNNIGTQFNQTILRLRNETGRLRGMGGAQKALLDDYAAQHNGADPLQELVRRRIRDLGGSKPGARWTDIQNDATVLGVDPKVIDNAAQEIYKTYQAAEYTIAKFAPHRVHPLTAENRIKTFTDQLFGKEPLSVKPWEPGRLSKPTVHASLIHEAGIRQYMSTLPQSQWVRPSVGNIATPGWRVIPNRGPLAPLAGNEVPEPLYAFLEQELARAKLIRSSEVKSWYIKVFDRMMAAERNVLSHVKRGWLSLPSTQFANGISNSLVSKMALQANGASEAEFLGRLGPAYAKVLKWRREGAKIPSIESMNRFSNAMHATDVASNIAGASEPMTKLGKVLPHNWGVQFQGVTEQAFKLALYETLEKKIGSKAAAAQVDKYLFDYSDRGVVLEIFDRFGLWPFSTFGVKSTELLFDTILHRPDLLAKYPRLKYLATREDDPSKNPNLPEWMRRSQFTIPLGGGEYTHLGRLHPLAGPTDMIADVAQGTNLPRELKNVVDKTMFTPAVNILQGRKTYTRDDRTNPNLLAKGQPPEEKGGLMLEEAFKAYFPAGRAIIEAGKAKRGERTAEDVAAQYGLGVRVTKVDEQKAKRMRLGGLRSELKAAKFRLGKLHREKADKKSIDRQMKYIKELQEQMRR